MRVVGLDLSLTSTGLAFVTDTYVETTRHTSKGKADATLEQRANRLQDIASWLLLTIGNHQPDLVVIEGPSFGQARQGGQHDRAGLWWLVVHSLHLDGVPVAEVPPSSRAKYATGKGNAAKDDVLSAVIRRYADVDVNGNDEADALVLAAMGARQLGHPIDDGLPLTNVGAMAKVDWPVHPLMVNVPVSEAYL